MTKQLNLFGLDPILEKIRPAVLDKQNPRVKLLTCSEILLMFPQMKNTNLMGLKLKKLGFSKKMYKIKKKIYQKYCVYMKK